MDELRADVEELERLLTVATRPKVKNTLDLELKKLQAEIIRMDKEKKSGDFVTEAKKMKAATKYSKNISTYAWDQTAKYMKIYVSLDGVQNIDKSNIKCEFTDRSFQLRVSDLNGVDHRLSVVNLFEDITPEDCYHKVKTDMVLVLLMKRQQSNTWAYVTQQEKKAKDKMKPKIDENKDPNDSLMDMMKTMYEDGDDEMKRTIAKAMTESRDKKSELNV